MLEAEQQIRRIVGHTGLAKLAVAVEHDIARNPANDTHTTTIQQAPILVA